MNILVPKTITAVMFEPGTNIPEIDTDAGEVAWVSGVDCAKGDRRVVDGKTFECVLEVAGAPQNTYRPGTAHAANYWLEDEGAPSNRWAPFDKYLFTKSRKLGAVTFALKPGFIDGLKVADLEADKLHITVKAGGVDLIPPIERDMWQSAFGLWEYLFGDLPRGTHYSLSDIPLHPDAVVTITAQRNDPEVEAAIGYLSVGNWKRLLAPLTREGGAQYGVESAYKDYSITNERTDGTYREVVGRKAKNISLSCVIDAAQAPAADALLAQILGKVVAIDVSNLPKYSHLSTVGKVSGSVRAVSWPTAEVALQIKGNV